MLNIMFYFGSKMIAGTWSPRRFLNMHVNNLCFEQKKKNQQKISLFYTCKNTVH